MKTTKFYFSPLRSVKIRTPDHTPKQKGRQRRRTSCLADKNLHGDGRQQDPHMLTPSTRQVHPQGFFFPNYVIMTAVFAKYRNGPIRREAAREIRDHYRMGGSALVEQGHKQLYLCHEESTRGERGGGGADGYRISLSREQLAVTEHRLGGEGGAQPRGSVGAGLHAGFSSSDRCQASPKPVEACCPLVTPQLEGNPPLSCWECQGYTRSLLQGTGPEQAPR